MGTLALAPNKRQCISHECGTRTFLWPEKKFSHFLIICFWGKQQKKKMHQCTVYWSLWIYQQGWSTWLNQNKESSKLVKEKRSGVCSWYLFAGSVWMTNLPLLSYPHLLPAPQTCSAQKIGNGAKTAKKHTVDSEQRQAEFSLFWSKMRGLWTELRNVTDMASDISV